MVVNVSKAKNEWTELKKVVLLENKKKKNKIKKKENL